MITRSNINKRENFAQYHALQHGDRIVTIDYILRRYFTICISS